MTFTRKIVAAGLAAAIAFPAFAVAQTANPAGAATSQQAGERPERGGGERAERQGGEWHGERRGERRTGLWNIAERLTAAETALAITDEQRPEWSAFTAAALAFAETGRRGARDGARESDTAEGPRTLNDLRAVRMLDRVIERGEARTAAAQDLRSAVDGLSTVLTPQQIETADRLLSELRPGRGGPRGEGRRGG